MIPIAYRFCEQDILLVFLYTFLKSKVMLKKKEFFYEEYYGCYLFEHNQSLNY